MAKFKQNHWDFYSQHINKATPNFTSCARVQNADTHAHKQHRLSQNISPVCSIFVLVIVSDMHLEPESEKRAKNVHFHTTKNIQIQSTLFRYFQMNSSKLTSDLFTVVWPQHSLRTKENKVKNAILPHMHLSVCVCVGSILWVKWSNFQLIHHESSRSSEKFNPIVEKWVNLNLSDMIVSALWISSVPYIYIAE